MYVYVLECVFFESFFLRRVNVNVCVCGNKSKNKGLISADRNNKATLLLTIPRSMFKSSTKDLSPRMFEINSPGDYLPYQQATGLSW